MGSLMVLCYAKVLINTREEPLLLRTDITWKRISFVLNVFVFTDKCAKTYTPVFSFKSRGDSALKPHVLTQRFNTNRYITA